MLISSLISQLEKYLEIYGDIPVVNWAFISEVEIVEITTYKDNPAIAIE